MLTNANKRGGFVAAEAGRTDAGAERLKQAAFALDPLGVAPEVGHLLPQGGASRGAADLIGEAKKGEEGSKPLRGKREEFCKVLTGWGGDGVRKRNCEAYEQVYGTGGASARVNSTRLMAESEVKARVGWLEKKVAEAKRHDYLAAQQEIDELRLGLVERGKKNMKLAAVALAAARDFEAAHGLAAKGGGGGATVEVEAGAVAGGGDGLNAVRAILAKVTVSG